RQCQPSRVLPPLVFFPISTHFTTPREIPSALTGGLKAPPTDILCLIIPNNACILCITMTTGIELADAYSPDTVIASFLGKEESGTCLSPSVADHPLGPATDHHLVLKISSSKPVYIQFSRWLTCERLKLPWTQASKLVIPDWTAHAVFVIIWTNV
ncbi:hypothetical protein Golob_013008, partial [Gossypium lobatum]|nr:hypothetical protein [Gossypium lobatum]